MDKSRAHKWISFMRYSLIFILIVIINLSQVNAQEESGGNNASSTPSSSTSRLNDAQQQLQQLDEVLQNNKAEQQNINNEIQQIGEEKARLNQNLIAVANNIQNIEAATTALEQDLVRLNLQEDDMNQTLLMKEQNLAILLGAMQRLGHNPPPALIVSPQNALQAVRAVQVMGAISTPLQIEAEELAQNLHDITLIRHQKQQNATQLRSSIAALTEQKAMLDGLLMQKNQQLTSRADALKEIEKAIQDIVDKAKSIDDLIETVEREVGLKEKIAHARSLDPEYKPSEQFGDLNRRSPQIDFSKTKGVAPIPARGAVIGHFGENDPIFGKLTGVQIATRAQATVISPADGWVVYAGEFRRYGNVVILNTGDNHLILMAGLEVINVQNGQFILVGEPVGYMGDKRFESVGSASEKSSVPTLYVEFRYKDKPVDPEKWWKKS